MSSGDNPTRVVRGEGREHRAGRGLLPGTDGAGPHLARSARIFTLCVPQIRHKLFRPPLCRRGAEKASARRGLRGEEGRGFPSTLNAGPAAGRLEELGGGVSKVRSAQAPSLAASPAC